MGSAILNKQITSLINGVSQQPDAIKFDSQAREQINAYSNTTRGLTKRAPTKHIAYLGTISPEAKVHFVDRDADEKYFLVVDKTSVRAYDINGNQKTVTNNTSSYLNSSNPKDSIRALTISDTTVLVNTGVTVTKSLTTSPARPIEHMVVIKESKFSKSYSVTIYDNAGVQVVSTGYLTPDGSDVIHSSQATLEYITAQVAIALNNAFLAKGVSSIYHASWAGNVVWLKTTDGRNFNVQPVSDPAATSMTIIKDKAQLFSDLPRYAPEGYVVKITGSEDAIASAGYYLRAEKTFEILSSIGLSEVSWVECPKPGVSVGFNNTTMPVQVKRNVDGTFTIDYISYANRSAGDEESAPDPKFVGSKIGGVFFYANRFGIFSGESIDMSVSGDLFSMYPTSLATALSTDPINVTISSPRVSILKYVVPFNESCILFSDTHQYIMQSQGGLSNATISIDPATDFVINSKVEPIATGVNIYFANRHGDFAEVREYYLNNITASKEASNVTLHVPTYIPSSINWITSNGSGTVLSFGASSTLDTVYIYQSQWSGNTKVQSSWHKFKFLGDEVIQSFFQNDTLYMLIRAVGSSEVRIVSMNLVNDYVEGLAPFIIHLDNRVHSSVLSAPTYDAFNNETTFVLPYPVRGTLLVVDARETERFYGESYQYTVGAFTNQVILKGDKRAVSLYFGDSYEMLYNLGRVYIKDSNDQGSVARTVGRTTVLKMLATYGDTCNFKVSVEIEGRDPQVSEFYGRVKGNTNNVFGQIIPVSGVFKVAVGAENKRVIFKIINDSHLPSTIHFLDFSLRYFNNSVGRVG